MKTNLQKCKDFLEEMNIKYEIEKYIPSVETLPPQWHLHIGSNHICNYGDLIIEFDEEEKFIGFECYGY